MPRNGSAGACECEWGAESRVRNGRNQHHCQVFNAKIKFNELFCAGAAAAVLADRMREVHSRARTHMIKKSRNFYWHVNSIEMPSEKERVLRRIVCARMSTRQ